MVVHPVSLLAEALAALLRSSGLAVAAVATRLHAIEPLLKNSEHAAILCDAETPDLEQPIVLRLIARSPHFRFLLLTTSRNSSQYASWRSMGQVHLISTHEPARTILDRVRRSIKGAEQVQGEPAHGSAHEASDHPLQLLTKRERQILPLVAGGLTVREVADQLGLSPSTVDNHKARIMQKLGVHKVPQLTRIALRAGLLE